MQRFKMEKIDQIICPVKINQKDWIGIESGELLEENLNKIFLLRGLVGTVRKEKRKARLMVINYGVCLTLYHRNIIQFL